MVVTDKNGRIQVIDEEVATAWIEMVEGWNELQLLCLKKAIEIVEKNRGKNDTTI